MKLFTKFAAFTLICVVTVSMNAQNWKAKYQLELGPVDGTTSSFYAQWLPTQAGVKPVWAGTTFYVLVPTGLTFTTSNMGTGVWDVTTLLTNDVYDMCGYDLVQVDLSNNIGAKTAIVGVPINLVKFTVSGTCPVGTGVRFLVDYFGTEPCQNIIDLGIANGLTLENGVDGYAGLINDDSNPLLCLPTACYDDANTADAGVDTQSGVTLLKRAGIQNGNWPMVRKSAFTAIESNTKGFVITRMTTTQVNAIVSPQEGMMVYDTTVNCLKLYDGVKWDCFSTATCP